MIRTEYLSEQYVTDFIEWMIPRISGEIKFKHSYIKNKDKKRWSCDSIYCAYSNYRWPFSCTLPDIGNVKGCTYDESERVLSEIELGMKKALENEDYMQLLLYSKAMLEWGGVTRSNYQILASMKITIINYFQSAVTRLDSNTVDTKDSFDGIWMNSGFTKLYSLLLDDFVIYDSRVGAALGLMVRKFLEEKNIAFIPEVLNFSYGNSRPTKSDVGTINKRNPGSKRYKFTSLSNNSKKHIKNNIYANWLVSELAKKSIFSEIKNPVRSLEAALFMIGYEVNSIGVIPE